MSDGERGKKRKRERTRSFAIHFYSICCWKNWAAWKRFFSSLSLASLNSFFQTTDQQSVLDHRTTIQTFFLLPKDFIRETINTYDSQDQLHFVTLSFRRVNCSQSFNTLTFSFLSSSFLSLSLFLSLIHRLITISEKVESGARIRNLILFRDSLLSQISFKFSSRSSKDIFFSQIHHFSERREIRINRLLMTYHSQKWINEY